MAQGQERAGIMDGEMEIMFQPGDVILPKSKSFVKALHASQKGRFCDNCLKAGKLSRCVGCQKMHYCGKACQKEDWKDGHSVECKSELFKNSSSIFGGPFSTLLAEGVPHNILRILAKRQRQPSAFSEKHTVYGTVERSFNDMMSHEDKPLAHMIHSMFLTVLLQELHRDPSYGPIGIDEGLLRRIFGVFATNASEMSSEDGMENIGGELHIAHSAFNHSCRPNAVRISARGEMEVRCIHPIPKGKEPVISYVVGDQNQEKRQALLKGYHFTCSCDLCSAELSSGSLIDYERLEQLKSKLEKCTETKYQSILGIRDEGLTLYRKLYHEYDQRITKFCMLTFEILYAYNGEFGDVPAECFRSVGRDLESRLRISVRAGSYKYAKFVEMMKHLAATGWLA